MKLTGITYSIALSLILLGSLPCYAGSIIYGNTIDVSGGLKLIDSRLTFPDGSYMTSASSGGGGVWGAITGTLTAQTDLVNYINSFVFDSLVWGQITGEISNQIDLSTKFTTKQDLVEKNAVNGYAGLNSNGLIHKGLLPFSSMALTSVPPPPSFNWLNDLTNWIIIPEFSTVVNFTNPVSVDVFYTDNIGIYDASWCNVGIFINNELEPVCTGAWSGVSGSMIFNQQSINCFLNESLHAALQSPPFTIHIKHRSQYCVYGNFAFDAFGVTRKLQIREVR